MLGVELTARLTEREFEVLGEEAGEVTPAGVGACATATRSPSRQRAAAA